MSFRDHGVYLSCVAANDRHIAAVDNAIAVPNLRWLADFEYMVLFGNVE